VNRIRLFSGEKQVAHLQTLQFFSMPLGGHDSPRRMGMRAYEQMTDLMCHDMTENSSLEELLVSCSGEGRWIRPLGFLDNSLDRLKNIFRSY
jgi:hypothetical protein